MKIQIQLIIITLSLFINAFADSKGIELSLLEEMSSKIRSSELQNSKDVLKLEDCLKLAVERSGKLQIAKDEYKLSIFKFKNSRRDLFPKVDVKYEEIDGTTTGEDFRGEGYKLEVQYPLFASGKIHKQFKQSRLNLEISRLKHDQMFVEVLTETEKAYYLWVEAKIKKRSVTELIDICDEAKAVVKKRFDSGYARDIDWLETQILTKEVKHKITDTENDLMLAKLSLRQVLDYYGNDFEIENLENFNEIQIVPENLIEIASKSRPDIRLNKLLEKVNKYNKDIAKAESRLQIAIDSYVGKRAENFDSEKLNFDDEYYVGVTGTLPLGSNTIEAQFIDQDSVPSAGQTTSTEFQSYNVKLNLLDNKYNSSKLEGLIKYYKSVEDSEKVKKVAIFEVGKNIIEVFKAYDQLAINIEKLELAKKKLEFQKQNLKSNETNVNEYLKEAISLFDAKANHAKSISGYFTAVSELNKAIGKPGFFNPHNGNVGNDYFNMLFDKPESPKERWFSLSKKENDSYYPTTSYDDLRFDLKSPKNKLLFWSKNKYQDPQEE